MYLISSNPSLYSFLAFLSNFSYYFKPLIHTFSSISSLINIFFRFFITLSFPTLHTLFISFLSPFYFIFASYFLSSLLHRHYAFLPPPPTYSSSRVSSPPSKPSYFHLPNSSLHLLPASCFLSSTFLPYLFATRLAKASPFIRLLFYCLIFL